MRDVQTEIDGLEDWGFYAHQQGKPFLFEVTKEKMLEDIALMDPFGSYNEGVRHRMRKKFGVSATCGPNVPLNAVAGVIARMVVFGLLS